MRWFFFGMVGAAIVACGNSGDDSAVSNDGGTNDSSTSSDASPASDAGSDSATSTDGGQFRIVSFNGPTNPAGDVSYAAIAGSGTVSGPVIEVLWNSIDKGTATLDWSTFDGATSTLAKYLAAYPKSQFSILFEPVSDNNQNHATPLDVLNSANQQICFCDNIYQGDQPPGVNSCFVNGKIDGTTANLTGLPVPFTGTFAARWQSFIGQAIARINAATYAANVLYVTFGVSNGGEDIPRCGGAESTLEGSKANLAMKWIMNVDAQDTAIENAHPKFPVVVGTSCFGASEPPDGSTATDDCAAFADDEATTHASHGVGMRITTLQAADILAVSESTPAVSDWVANTAAHPTVPIVWQTSFESAPTATASPMCTRNGSLATLLPFVTSHSSPSTPLRVLEAYYTDLEGTYASGYNDACWPAGTVPTPPYAPYDSAFKAAIATE